MTKEELFAQFDNDIKNNDIVVYMKGNKNFPQCGFSGMIAHIFQTLGKDFKDINVLEDDNIRNGIKDYNNWPTIPQTFVKGEFIGGCDFVKEMFETGELAKLLKDNDL